jgi:anti-sigma factor RsiW
MNCRSAQEKIVDAMASREPGLRGDLDQHVRECAGCHAFLASHASLASAIDSHLRLIANEPVPPSLLPAVRARLEQEAAPRQWIFSWRFAAVATVVVLLVATVIGMRDSDKPGRPKETTAKVAHGSPDVNRPPTVSSQIQLPAPKASRFAAAVRKASIPAHSSAPEVLVLPEEQQAFRRFVSDISKDRASANALVSAAPDSGDGPVEIALLAIENVEIKPLEGTDSE